MKNSFSRAIHLRDYVPPAWWVDVVELDVSIGDDGDAFVGAVIMVRRNDDVPAGPLVLDGEALELLEVSVDGRFLPSPKDRVRDGRLELDDLPASCVVATRVRIRPDLNTTLSGLYRSKDGYFTQCEAEGFRRITYFPDRPDVMARYTVTLHADKARFPDLLANGNLIDCGDEADGRHWARWEDPFPKPCYLFAMVAAKLERLDDRYTTASGREVNLSIHVEPGKLDQCGFAMHALKKSMRWDEERFGLELDLDRYMIVAVGDFNMGAMENKGLNIFNTKYVLARPDVATDTDYVNIDRVVAHEYFHNWTGNRVTCRDWFQLSLKEGLTVFRDQEYGSDMYSRAVQRIQEVRGLRAAQFPEDAGPMAHPVRPASYEEINNFYTATVYEKGAEVVRMIHTLLGEGDFQRGMKLYFERHDGQAVTCDDFVSAMQDASGVDLGQFRRWYEQAGTPRLTAHSEFDRTTGRWRLTLSQNNPPTAYEKRLAEEGLTFGRDPLHIPVAIGLLSADGREILPTRVLSLTDATATFEFDLSEHRLDAPPLPSLLRNYSAPVVLEAGYSDAALATLMAHDSDEFNRWEAGQRLATRLMVAQVERVAQGAPIEVSGVFVSAFASTLAQADADPAFAAEALALPSEAWLGDQMAIIDPEAIHRVRRAFRRALAEALRAQFEAVVERHASAGAYAPDPAAMGRRALRNLALGYLMELEDSAIQLRVLAQFRDADNMTDQFAALALLAHSETPLREIVLAEFYARWKDEALVVDKWLAVQATSPSVGTLARVRELMTHEAFDMKNPNKVYALVRTFCAANPRHFHAADGSGYAYAAEVMRVLDPLNPQVASRVARAFDRWRRFDETRQRHARAALERIAGQPELSPDVAEVVARALA
ncbi:MAG: aminopeptidase N [Gammaproteobacteria bacterium]|nr:aminopeptidase N [Gammaproteobacteria bacterium]MBU0773068.1 aminopeptidase N [Gammaproteobacteria bacterium]MBU0854878.1 aminopeptidase N [Gammaproteobacteria bacterium]MBU1845276.1 aminopeptidase N [Gammaproteobacteria bacterium]